ncbi:MAG TPA: glucose 1-dehydrogenase [Terriglobales bacterium]|nr:glucose 1-dehydrogenase [Terriglobales bacterium]
MIDLRDKVAIVTGGAQGIGRAISEAFAQAGASVFIADVDDAMGAATASSIRERGGDATFCHADVSIESHAAAVTEQAAAKHNRLDVLCNNAAYLAQFHNLTEAPVEEWERCVSVSLMGTRHFSREALRRMVAQRRGSIINIASVQSLVGARDSVAYSTIKTALIGFTRSVAYDYGPYNIRVNAICPGAIQTRISPKPGEELYRRQVAKTFLGRVGQPHEIGGAAVFLASDAAAYITGTVLAVDGGWSAM